jgi:hypothetical protein
MHRRTIATVALMQLIQAIKVNQDTMEELRQRSAVNAQERITTVVPQYVADEDMPSAMAVPTTDADWEAVYGAIMHNQGIQTANEAWKHEEVNNDPLLQVCLEGHKCRETNKANVKSDVKTEWETTFDSMKTLVSNTKDKTK